MVVAAVRAWASATLTRRVFMPAATAAGTSASNVNRLSPAA
jgi:hypothetical protein